VVIRFTRLHCGVLVYAVVYRPSVCSVLPMSDIGYEQCVLGSQPLCIMIM